MTLREIKDHVLHGDIVHWKTNNYIIIVDNNKNSWFIKSIHNNNYIGLTWLDGVTLNGKEEDFYLGGENELH